MNEGGEETGRHGRLGADPSLAGAGAATDLGWDSGLHPFIGPEVKHSRSYRPTVAFIQYNTLTYISNTNARHAWSSYCTAVHVQDTQQRTEVTSTALTCNPPADTGGHRDARSCAP
jgi:hypothetical protein